jgi:hypothetical protein
MPYLPYRTKGALATIILIACHASPAGFSW